jgi:hypothetical protein
MASRWGVGCENRLYAVRPASGAACGRLRLTRATAVRADAYHGRTMTQLRIAELLASSPVDPAAHLDPERVRHYAELPGDLPPVVAFCTEQGLLLADGYHRVAAAQARGLDTIEAEIRHGSAHDALRYAASIGAKQRGLSEAEVMRHLQRRSGGRWLRRSTSE